MHTIGLILLRLEITALTSITFLFLNEFSVFRPYFLESHMSFGNSCTVKIESFGIANIDPSVQNRVNFHIVQTYHFMEPD